MSASNEKSEKVIMKIEDIINNAIHVNHKNVVNFRLIQTVLHILARQLRVLEMRVEIRGDADSKDEDEVEDVALKSDGTKSRNRSSVASSGGTTPGVTSSDTAVSDASSAKKHKKKDGSKSKADFASKAELMSKADVTSKADAMSKADVTSKADAMSKADVGSESEKGKKKKGKKSEVEFREKVTSVHEFRSRTSIDVVTQSQFDILQGMVDQLIMKAGPIPEPTMPDNETLRKDLASGSADLATTMDAMKVNARVQAAEGAIVKLSSLLTELAASGALPEGVAAKAQQLHDEMLSSRASGADAFKLASRKSVAYDEEAFKKPEETVSMMSRRQSLASRSVLKGPEPGVTQSDLEEVLQKATDDLKKQMNASISKALAVAESSSAAARAATEKLEIALRVNERLNTLYSSVKDYAEQLTGFDSGLGIQLQGFKQQMVQMKSDLQSGLIQLEAVNSNAETAAVMELTERYQGLAKELDSTLGAHSALITIQNKLSEQAKILIHSVEMMREDKADKDEILDALRDKADNLRLEGLLDEVQFKVVIKELEDRLAVCYDKFNRQEKVWMTALKDLSNALNLKADVLNVTAMRDEFEKILDDLRCKLAALAKIIGDPKTAILTRKLSKDGKCGSCMGTAHIESQDDTFGKPPLMPAARAVVGAPAAPPPSGREECLADLYNEEQEEQQVHVCHRWVGGSHTLLTRFVKRERAGPDMDFGPESHKYTGIGKDGRLYMFEEPCHPCAECNKTDDDKVPEPPVSGNQGGGDEGQKRNVSIVVVE